MTKGQRRIPWEELNNIVLSLIVGEKSNTGHSGHTRSFRGNERTLLQRHNL
jgi:hypothetical protein